jgi:hypothetical protein
MAKKDDRLATIQAEYESLVDHIVNEANKKKIRLRAMGGLGFLIHCPNRRELLQAFNRVPSDIDFMAPGSQEKQIDELFRELGYKEKGGQGVTMEVWSDRRIFEHPVLPHVDVFFDELDFCHKVNFRKRMDIDSPTISLADLMLGKLQIVEINEKDLQDLIVAVLEHPLGEKDAPEVINVRYIADLMAQDWGFYYTAVSNLKKAQKLALQYQLQMTAAEEMQQSARQLGSLIDRIEEAPKSFRWKARAVIGTKVKWYRNPGEEYREVAEG